MNRIKPFIHSLIYLFNKPLPSTYSAPGLCWELGVQKWKHSTCLQAGQSLKYPVKNAQVTLQSFLHSFNTCSGTYYGPDAEQGLGWLWKMESLSTYNQQQLHKVWEMNSECQKVRVWRTSRIHTAHWLSNTLLGSWGWVSMFHKMSYKLRLYWSTIYMP